nr:hypothetical protein [Tanacetum cinerariifolium]
MNYVPVVARFQTNDIARTKDNIIVGQAEKKKEPKQEYILIPICITDPLISQGPKDSAMDAGKKATEVDASQVSDNDGSPVSIVGPSFVNAALPSPINAAETPVQQKSDGIFISQDKYVADILKNLAFPLSMIGSLMYLTASRPDITFAVCVCARNFTTGGCQFIGKRLISWQCKKKTIVANSTSKAGCVAVA